MTKKIGISLKDERYEWASREVAEGRAESVSALIAEGLTVLEARSRLEALVADLRAAAGEPGGQVKARIEEALRGADEAYRRHLAAGAADAA
jgi:Arc/MetJ-type ribon-helix-helix transcriptional regulator